MYAGTFGGLSRQRALGVMVLVTLLAGAGLLFLKQAAAGSIDDVALARASLRDASAAAVRYSFLAAEELTLSGDPVEARSNEILMAFLDNNGLITPDQRQISYDDPEEMADGRQRLRINIQCAKVPLAGIVGFLREVELGRKNLALLSFDMTRERPGVDSWNAHFVYGAVILRQAKSRS